VVSAWVRLDPEVLAPEIVKTNDHEPAETRRTRKHAIHTTPSDMRFLSDIAQV
jgi:hypothetical protein